MEAKNLKDMTAKELINLKVKEIVEEDKITTIIKKNPADKKSTGSRIIQTKDSINLQML